MLSALCHCMPLAMLLLHVLLKLVHMHQALL